MKILSLFDGISVAQQALKELGVDVEYYASEIDKYAIQITQKNHPNTIQLGSVVGLKVDFQPDLLIGGSPCQDLSIAKKNREGLKGSRSGLFWEYVRILKEVKPKYFVLENVASMPKEAKDTITEALGVEPIMINAALVSAQNRKRLFWVGRRVDYAGTTYRTLEIPQPEDRGILLKDILEENVDEKYILNESALKTLNRTSYGAKGHIAEPEGKTNILTFSMGGGGGNGVYTKVGVNYNRKEGIGKEIDKAHTLSASDYRGLNRNQTQTAIRVGSLNSGGQGDRIYSPDGKSVNLSANGGGRGAKTGLYAVALTETRTDKAKKIRREYRKKTGKDYSPRREKELKPREDEKANTITTGQTKESLILENSIIRKLTSIECERLQSLSDNYTEGVSNTQRYKALGNAFNCEVIKHIIGEIWR